MKKIEDLKQALFKAIDQYEVKATQRGKKLSPLRLNDIKILRGFIFSAKDYESLVVQMTHYLKMLRADSLIWFRSRLRNHLLAVVKRWGLNKRINMLEANSGHWQAQSATFQAENADLVQHLRVLEARLRHLQTLYDAQIKLDEDGDDTESEHEERGAQQARGHYHRSHVETVIDADSEESAFDEDDIEPSVISSDTAELRSIAAVPQSHQARYQRVDLCYIDRSVEAGQSHLKMNVHQMIAHAAQLQKEVESLRASNQELSDAFVRQQGEQMKVLGRPRSLAPTGTSLVGAHGRLHQRSADASKATQRRHKSKRAKRTRRSKGAERPKGVKSNSGVRSAQEPMPNKPGVTGAAQ